MGNMEIPDELIDQLLGDYQGPEQLSAARSLCPPVGLLAAIPGISVDSSKGLITRFGSIAAVALATEADLQSVPGVGPERARAILQALNQPTPSQAPEVIARNTERHI